MIYSRQYAFGFLGVVCRMLYSFKGSIKGIRRTKLACVHLNVINTKLLCCSGKLPSEFNRQPRSLEDLNYWKATELRSFLLYTGMVVLKDVIKKEVYNHFVCLNIAIILLCCSDDNRRNASTAETFLYTMLIMHQICMSNLLCPIMFIPFNIYQMMWRNFKCHYNV